MPMKLEYNKERRTIVKRPFGSWIKHPKLVVNWHGMIAWTIWKVRRYPKMIVCGFGPLEIVWPRRGYFLPESEA